MGFEYTVKTKKPLKEIRDVLIEAIKKNPNFERESTPGDEINYYFKSPQNPSTHAEICIIIEEEDIYICYYGGRPWDLIEDLKEFLETHGGFTIEDLE